MPNDSIMANNRRTFLELATLAWPMVISQGAFAVMIFTDRYFMSLISPTHISAAMAGGVTFYCCISLLIGTVSFTNTLVSRSFGAGRRAACSRILNQALLITLLAWPPLLLLGSFVAEGFNHVGHDPEQVQLEQTYFRILLLGSLFGAGRVAFASWFTGIGRTRVVMIADLTCMAFNIPITWLLVFGLPGAGVPALGIAGAAWATLIASGLSLLIYFGFYLHAGNRQAFQVRLSLRPDREILGQFLRLGLPSGTEMFLNVSAFNLFLIMFQSYGVTAGAAAAIVFNWDILCFIPMMGLNHSVNSLVGRYLGAGNETATSRVIASGFIMGLAWSGCMAVLFLTQRDTLIGVFLQGSAADDAIIALAWPMMAGLATYAMADAIILVAGGVLRGAGDTRWLMITSVALHWLMVVGQVLTIHVWELDPLISWFVLVAMIISIALAYALRLLGPAWRRAGAAAFQVQTG